MKNYFWIKDGVVICADTRSTGGSTVADKNCAKIHYLAPNIYCCGAGTAADCDHVTGKKKIHFQSKNRENYKYYSIYKSLNQIFIKNYLINY
jgi:20S proteasome alpha/beta subunit